MNRPRANRARGRAGAEAALTDGGSGTAPGAGQRQRPRPVFGALTGDGHRGVHRDLRGHPRPSAGAGTLRELLRERFVLAHEVLGKITESTGALCLDVTAATEWSRPDMWSEDGLHPIPRGHQWFAESIADLLERATGTPCRPR
ncbi:hypothetical protein SANTM175S_01921 [Streptomyces antimycoticus]